ncbi:MAG: NlpC/P60 family protein [Deltaproteobacteria bacterium]|nr:NlpC/P60 family protein [Deltaproteobacteria bacterium]
MMKRRIFLWMGLIVLFVTFGLCQEILAKGYKVKRGDNLVKISKKFGVTTDALRAANGLTGNALKPKQILVIPDQGKVKLAKSQKKNHPKAENYVVTKGDTLQVIATKTGYSVKELKKWNRINSRHLRIGQKIVLAKSRYSRDMTRVKKSDANQAEEMDDPLDEEGEEVNPGDELVEAEIDQQSGSDPLGKWNSPDERSLFVRVSKGFLGAPYRFGGSSVRGLDCSAFVKKIYQFFDISLPRTAREQSRVGKNIAREELKEGDLVFFNTRRAFGHVGIYIGNNEFVHASAGRERMVKIDTLEKPYYDKRFVKAVRIKELESGI